MNCPGCNEEEIEPGTYQCGSRQINDEWWETKQCLRNQLKAVTAERDRAVAEVKRLREAPTHDATDDMGYPVPADEPHDAMIRVWCMSPHPTDSDVDELWCRSWQAFIYYVREGIENLIEHQFDNLEVDELNIGISRRLVSRDEYDAVWETNSGHAARR